MYPSDCVQHTSHMVHVHDNKMPTRARATLPGCMQLKEDQNNPTHFSKLCSHIFLAATKQLYM